MIVTKFFREREDGVVLYRVYSDADMMIRCNEDDSLYEEVISPQNSSFTYIETDIPIEREKPDENQDLIQAAKILLGVEE